MNNLTQTSDMPTLNTISQAKKYMPIMLFQIWAERTTDGQGTFVVW